MPIYKLAAIGTFPDEAWNFTLHVDSALDVASVQAQWLTASGLLWTGGIDAIIADEVIMRELTTARLDPLTGQQVAKLRGLVNRPGASGSSSLPPQVSVGVTLRTALATRAGRGRFYLPPYSTAAIGLGKLGSGSQSITVNAVQAMFHSLTGAGIAPVVWGRNTLVATPVTAFDVGNIFDTQRGRRASIPEVRVAGTISA